MLLIPILIIGLMSYTIAATNTGVAIPDTTVADLQTENRAYVETLLGTALPPNVQILGVLQQGTPTDTVQIKLQVPLWGLFAANEVFAIQAEAAQNVPPNPFASEHAWWDLHTHDTVLRTTATFGDFDQVISFTAQGPDDPNTVLIYLIANRF